MVDIDDTHGQLKFAPDILRRLGEELIPNPEQGLIELVKNAYDADAKTCNIMLSKVLRKGGTIIIEDDGNGMAVEDLLNGFLIIGRSRKSPRKRSKKYRRLPVGDKGLGRLAALRLGNKVIVKSRPRGERNVQYTLTIDWQLIDKANVVEDIQLPIQKDSTLSPPGVTIEIVNLRKSLTKTEVKQLARELVLLSDPFQSKTSFKAQLVTKEYKEYDRQVRNTYFEDAPFHLKGTITNGVGEVVLSDGHGNLITQTKLPLKKEARYQAPAASFELWVFILASSYTSKTTSLSAVKEWIKNFGGVHVYHRDLRVRPYGDPGFDWLDMNLMRASHPEFRPSTNTVIGRVTIEDPTLDLTQPTNRVGFVESQSFFEIKRFAQDCLKWMAEYRLSEAETSRKAKKVQAHEKSSNAREEVQAILAAGAPQEKLVQLKQAFSEFVYAEEAKLISLQEELQLYRSLATAGTTSAVFAHESAKPITLIKLTSDTIERRGHAHLNELYEKYFEEQVARLRRIHSSLNIYSQFPIYHLKRAKRRSGIIDVKEVWQSVATLFKPLLNEAKIALEINFPDDKAEIRGSIALVEAIATNILTNSVHALTKSKKLNPNRRIQLDADVDSDSIVVTQSDSGPGIQELSLDEIWLPGKTTNLQGTGFGLTIVRDSVHDLQGEIRAVANGKLGGAEFIVRFPLYTNS
jgi:signal transduction histidine kinase